jgi:exodeoxyribonuclease-3
MKVISLNVNGVRSAVKKGLIPWLLEEKADVICLQEIKCDTEQFLEAAKALKDYHLASYCAVKKGYSGVAIFSLKKPDQVHTGLGWEPCDEEGRYLQADFAGLSIASIYLPSGSAGPHRQEKKFIFMENFEKNLARMQKDGRRYILCGDWNIVRSELDIKNWKSNQKNSGCLPEERAWMNTLFERFNFVDVYRELHPNKIAYSWWSQRGQAFAKDVGWRIDYQITSDNLKNKLLTLEMLREPKFSDHAPLIATYDL